METDPTRIVEKNIGHVLKELRLDAGYTIEQMAETVGVQPKWLILAEAGEKHISFTKFLRIVATFGGTVEVKTAQRIIKTDAIYPIPPYTSEELKTREDEKKKRNRERTDRWLDRMVKYVDEADGISDNEEQQ